MMDVRSTNPVLVSEPLARRMVVTGGGLVVRAAGTVFGPVIGAAALLAGHVLYRDACRDFGDAPEQVNHHFPKAA